MSTLVGNKTVEYFAKGGQNIYRVVRRNLRVIAAAFAIAIASVAALLIERQPAIPVSESQRLVAISEETEDAPKRVPVAEAMPASDEVQAAESPRILFRDGRSVAINFRASSVQNLISPYEMLLNYNHFKSLAEAGDADAQYLIARALEVCRWSAPASREQLEESIATMYETLRLPSGRNGEYAWVLMDGENLEEAEASARQKAEGCWNIPEAERDNDFDWLSKAAANSHVGALVVLGDRYQSGTAAATQSLDRAWRLGSFGALGVLANVYKSGEGLEASDQLLSAAYTYLYSHIYLEDLELHGPINGDLLRAVFQGRLDELTSSLQPNQMDKVLDLAQKMLLENPRCCESNFY